ncbi:hypothetical protein EDD11_001210 [Mortierella claussenii]|nr:hypothetical protein EDD11_001210 [Mortierella claussenii]
MKIFTARTLTLSAFAVSSSAVPVAALPEAGISNTKIVAKALLNLKLDFCTDIRPAVKILAKENLLIRDITLELPTIKAGVEDEAHKAINTKVDKDAMVMVLGIVRQHGQDIISKCSPHSTEERENNDEEPWVSV